ncbi:hypothetical protein CLV43_114302 [Umezawaea tangerina]|uniref:Uncharacterized protein n=1 Tax=Umezawaea tangerina TaxID=84725 RepID=A0A2T0SPP6_9PSEU|nr:hypothetical protein CLV43_114302 [Umezawaea tangerina]
MSISGTKQDVHFPPLQNGVDYLVDAVERLSGAPTPRDLKYAVLHLHAGVEVLLKYRLICEDWTLVLAEDSATATQQQYEAGQFRSIGAADAIKRLRKIDGITIGNGQRTAAAALDKLRNQLQHHGLTSTTEAVESQTSKVLGFILDFIDAYITPESHLTSADEQFLERSLPSIRSGLGSITSLVSGRMQRLHPALDGVTKTWCPDCGQPAVLLESDAVAAPVNIPAHVEPRCAFCTRRWESREEYFEDFLFDRLGLSWQDMAETGDSSVNCPECGKDMVAWYDPDTGLRSPAALGRCFNAECEEDFNDTCPRCSRYVWNENITEESHICSDCWDALVSD